MDNPWKDLPTDAPFVLREDRPLIEEHREKAKLLLELFPVPFIGAWDAPVVLLTLNPSGGNTEHTADYVEQYRRMLAFKNRVPFLPLDPAFSSTPGAKYWSERMRVLCNRVGRELLAQRVLCIQYFPYQSRVFHKLPDLLPSQQFGFELCRRAIVQGRLVVVLRSLALWSKAVPELGQTPITLRSPRSPYLTPENMGEDAFEAVVSRLRI